jgi:hypothetical protein
VRRDAIGKTSLIMNALHLSTAVFTSAFAVLTLPSVDRPAAPQPRASTSVTAPAGVGGWEAALMALSTDPDGFRSDSLKEIEGYALATDAMSRHCGASRNYLQTRLQALREHVDYARAEVVKLPTSPGDTDFKPTYAHFYRTMNGLHEAFRQTLNELNDGA